MEGCLCLRVNIWERENKTQKDKKQFLERVNQREQIVQQTLTGFPCFLLFVISYLALRKDGVLFKFILQLNVRLLAVNGFKNILMLLNRALITTKFAYRH